jgi:hypothetical protein
LDGLEKIFEYVNIFDKDIIKYNILILTILKKKKKTRKLGVVSNHPQGVAGPPPNVWGWIGHS